MYQPEGGILWDAWFAFDGHRHHAYYLQAPRDLADPEDRHLRAEVGHAVSADLVHWEEVGTAFRRGPEGSWDDGAIWTGSTLLDAEGTAHLFYTSFSSGDGPARQRIGHATAADLHTFTRTGPDPIVDVDPVWYEDGGEPDDDPAWRDPHAVVVAGRLHLFVTARSAHGPRDERGTIGLVTSDDWASWTVHPPIAETGHFWSLEVPQVLERHGRWWLLVSALPTWHSARRLARRAGLSVDGGLVAFVADAPTGPYRLAREEFVLGDPRSSHYTAKIVPTPDGDVLVPSRFRTADDVFLGALIDPLPVTWRDDGPHVDPPPW